MEPRRKTQKTNHGDCIPTLGGIATALIVFTCIHLTYPLLHTINNTPSILHEEFIKITDEQEKCDVSQGDWVPDPNAPYYTNTVCPAIQDHQNCMKYGRPDTGFMKWRWKPDGCDLPGFNPFQFLELLRGKSVAFVGDSVGRNQMQSMICLLSRAEYPIEVPHTYNKNSKRWKYVKYNTTFAHFWTPFLVNSEERDHDGPGHTGLFNLYLDEFDRSWTTKIDEFDYIVINSGHWITRLAVYFENRRIVGCRYCHLENVDYLPPTYAYRRIFRTAFRAINSRRNFKGVTFLRTFAPAHFENGTWDKGGDCKRQRPYYRNETSLEDQDLEMYNTQLEEFRAAADLGRKRFRLMDVTRAMLLRPDGHPSRYGHWPDAKVALYNDCVHWCLPGPIDSWADILQHLIKVEARREYKERLEQKNSQ